MLSKAQISKFRETYKDIPRPIPVAYGRLESSDITNRNTNQVLNSPATIKQQNLLTEFGWTEPVKYKIEASLLIHELTILAIHEDKQGSIMPVASEEDYELTGLVLNDIQNTSISVAALKGMFDVVEIQCDANPSIAMRSYSGQGDAFDETIAYYNSEAERDSDFGKIYAAKIETQTVGSTKKKSSRSR